VSLALDALKGFASGAWEDHLQLFPTDRPPVKSISKQHLVALHKLQTLKNGRL